MKNKNVKKSKSVTSQSKFLFKKYFFVIPIVVVSLFSAGILISQSANLSRLEKQKADYEMQLSEQINVNKQLEAQLKSDNQDAYIEKKAREKGYVKSNEIVFYDVSSCK